MSKNPSKRCSECRRTKPLFEFDDSPKAVDGKEYRCTECKREYMRENKRQARQKQRTRAAMAAVAAPKARTKTNGGITPEETAIETTVAGPAYISIWALPVYEPAKDTAFYRNDGHKHIKSRGAGC